MRAIENIFPGAQIRLAENELTANVEHLDHFAERLRDQRIRDTARDVMLRSAKSSPRDNGRSKIKFWLNKQAAFMDRVNFTDSPSVLGDIRVVIECDSPEHLIDMLAPGRSDDERVAGRDAGGQRDKNDGGRNDGVAGIDRARADRDGNAKEEGCNAEAEE